jgi:uncharacterized sporulation protein YeaH/YhbH (DUF444 family)
MSFKIESDVNRFNNIVKGKVKSNMKQFVSSQDLLGQQGNKSVRIPINNIDLPRFAYGSKNGGGAGMGDGKVGDPMGGQDQESGTGKAGNEKGEHQFAVEFTAEELAQMLGQELQLPDVDPKGKGKTGSTKSKYNNINRVGNEGLRHFRRTYKEALKRCISTGTYDPSNPMVIPIKSDRRYKSSSIVNEPDVNAVIIYIMDVSGSMGDEQKHIVKSEVYWTDLWLNQQYKGLVSRFIIHDTEASEVDRQQFFTVSESGGTSISSGYEFASHLIKTEHPFSDWNVYLMHYSDGDNWSADDNDKATAIVKDHFLPNCNMFGYEQVTSSSGSGAFYDVLAERFSQEEKVSLHKTNDRSEVLSALKFFLGKGK